MAGIQSAQSEVQTPDESTDKNIAAAEAKQKPSDRATADEEVTDLLTGDFAGNWQIFNSDATTDPKSVWKVVQETPDAEPVLICTGEPRGFIFTAEKYSDFELTLEWKYPKDASGNSGILVFTQNEPRIWPTSVQVQLHQPKAGSIFPSGDATTDNTRDADPDLARPVNTWNECRIISRGGRISVDVNGKKAGEISGAKPASGSIALQSEGSEVHFRRIRLKKIAKEAPEPSATDPAKGSDQAPCSETVPALNVSAGFRQSVSAGTVSPLGTFHAAGRKRTNAASPCGRNRRKSEVEFIENR